MHENPLTGKVALVTGAARRIGAEICRALHEAGMTLAVHYRNSADDARVLRDELQHRRAQSAFVFQGDLLQRGTPENLAEQVVSALGRIDLLVNNASNFYPTPLAEATVEQWDDLLGINLRAPFFLSRACAAQLGNHGGSIVNLADIHGEHPLAEHSIYNIAKAGVVMMTRTLARELAPRVRVNAIAPGAILWPEHKKMGPSARERILERIPLGRTGDPQEIARAVVFLARDATYTTGQVIAVCGGRSIHL